MAPQILGQSKDRYHSKPVHLRNGSPHCLVLVILPVINIFLFSWMGRSEFFCHGCRKQSLFSVNNSATAHHDSDLFDKSISPDHQSQEAEQLQRRTLDELNTSQSKPFIGYDRKSYKDFAIASKWIQNVSLESIPKYAWRKRFNRPNISQSELLAIQKSFEQYGAASISAQIYSKIYESRDLENFNTTEATVFKVPQIISNSSVSGNIVIHLNTLLVMKHNGTSLEAARTSSENLESKQIVMLDQALAFKSSHTSSISQGDKFKNISVHSMINERIFPENSTEKGIFEKPGLPMENVIVWKFRTRALRVDLKQVSRKKYFFCYSYGVASITIVDVISL